MGGGGVGGFVCFKSLVSETIVLLCCFRNIEDILAEKGEVVRKKLEGDTLEIFTEDLISIQAKEEDLEKKKDTTENTEGTNKGSK